MGAPIETSRRFPLERGGAERIELRWGASFREVRVLFDGAEVAIVDRKKMPPGGKAVPLPDGSVLSLRLRGMLGMEMLRDGGHVPGSDLHPARLLKNAAALMALAAVLDAALDGALMRRFVSLAGNESVPLPRNLEIRLGLDGALLLLVLPTALGSRIALGLGIAAFASRFGVGGERSSWILIYGVATTWLLATHFFATFKRPART